MIVAEAYQQEETLPPPLLVKFNDDIIIDESDTISRPAILPDRLVAQRVTTQSGTHVMSHPLPCIDPTADSTYTIVVDSRDPCQRPIIGELRHDL